MERENTRIADNGVEIHSYRNPDVHGFYISLFLKAGCMYEDARDVGITHFLEHVAIRNVNALMGGELYSLLDKYGVEFNASTYNEMVQFYVSGAKKNFGVGIQIIKALFSPIVLTPSDVRAECARIKAEIRENDERGSLLNFTNSIVHAGTTLSRTITGTASVISRITPARLERYRRSVLTRENAFIYVTGAFDTSQLDELTRTVGECEIYEGEAHTGVAPVSDAFFKRTPEVYVKNADYTMLRFTFDMDMTRISSAEADILYDILLGGYNSRFFIEMSEREGIFYDLSGSVERYKNIGTISFSYEVKPSQIYTAVEKTLQILRSFVTSPPTEDECMKAGYVDNAYMLYDDSRELNFTFAYDNHVLSSGYRSIEERAAMYEAVTPADISAIADMLFRPENLTLTVKGRRKRIDTERLGEIIRNFDNEK